MIITLSNFYTSNNFTQNLKLWLIVLLHKNLFIPSKQKKMFCLNIINLKYFKEKTIIEAKCNFRWMK